MTRIAKLFRCGRSQAVRLPPQFRFEGREVFIRRDPATGDVILSQRSESWQSFFALVQEGDVPEEFMTESRD
jgi:antitoxin VapB